VRSSSSVVNWLFLVLVCGALSGCFLIPSLMDSSSVPASSILQPRVVPEPHPQVLEQVDEYKQPLTIANPLEAQETLSEVLARCKDEMQRAHPKSRAAIQIGIASPVDEGGNLRPTRVTNWILTSLYAGAIDSDLVPLKPRIDEGESGRLDSYVSPLDVLFDNPNQLFRPSLWKDVNPLLNVLHNTKIDAMLLSRVRLGRERNTINLEYILVDLKAKRPKPRLVDRVILPLTGAIAHGADVFLLIDASGSMQTNDPVRYRIEAARFLVRELEALTQDNPDADYRVASVFFNSQVLAYSELTPIPLHEPDAVERLLSSIEQGGAQSATNLDAPFEEVLSHARRNQLAHPLVVLFFTDGVHTQGPMQAVWRQLHGYTQESISTVKGTAIGLGNEPNHEVLQDIRNSLGGDTGVQRISLDSIGPSLYGTFFRPMAALMSRTGTQHVTLPYDPETPLKTPKISGDAGRTQQLQIIVTPRKPRLILDEDIGP
jgi:hypothetical protein